MNFEDAGQDLLPHRHGFEHRLARLVPLRKKWLKNLKSRARRLPVESGISDIKDLRLAPSLEDRPAKADIQLIPDSARFGPVGMGHLGKDQNHITRSQWNISSARVVVFSGSCHQIHNRPLSKDARLVTPNAA